MSYGAVALQPVHGCADRAARLQALRHGLPRYRGAVTAVGTDELYQRLDSGVPHSARVWNYWVGGKDHFAADRKAGDAVKEAMPEIVDIARESRRALARVVQHLVAEGIDQFLDIGTGLPTANNTHEVAQQHNPEARVVYVDNDPMVLAHARALLIGTSEGSTAYIDADVRSPRLILEQADATLDFHRPIGLILFGVLGHVPDIEQVRQILATLVQTLPAGSMVAINDGTYTTLAHLQTQEVANRAGHNYTLRRPVDLMGFFGELGLELVEPGVVSTPQWRPTEPTEQRLAVHCGVGRKP
jgi:O-methyltransferase involved in polyketide biosynthesis